MNAYARLEERFTRAALFDEAAAILGWDAAAMMPHGGAAARGEQMAALVGLSHDLVADDAVAQDLARAVVPEGGWESANLELMREAHLQATALPRDLVEAITRANSACEILWREARDKADFPLVRGALTEVVNLVRQKGELLGERLEISPYDALMNQYQRGVRSSDVALVFAAYEKFLADVLPEVESAQSLTPPAELPAGPYPIASQEALCRRLIQEAGLNFTHARLDRSVHPFCGGTPTDIRLTTRYDETDFCVALLGVLHETGHALYEQNLPRVYLRQPVGRAAGMAVHESQSLIVEMQAVRSDPYLRYLAPVLTDAFGCLIEEDVLRVRLRGVRRSLIRVEADELTYPAHVILRFRLEQALISGQLPVRDLPGAWNEAMRDVLDVVPANDRQGCLQDIHWYDGTFGYFPSYTLGAMAAAQLMAAARRAVPELDTALGTGDLSPLNRWLKHNVHSHGARLTFNDLLVEATGKALDPGSFTAHLRARYLPGQAN
jgi:carboxypeptidase Taq